MKKSFGLKAVLAAGVTMLMTATAATQAFADPLPPDSGDLVIHKYIGAPVTGTTNNGTLQDTSGWSNVVAANGVAFDLYKVGAAVVHDPVWPDVPPQGTYVKNATSGNLEVYNGAMLLGEYALAAATPDSVTTATDGTATASALAKGFYLVVENAAKSTSITDAKTDQPMYISQTAAPFIVQVPMTDPSGDGWLDPVHVYPKNEALTVDKVAETAGGVAVGDVIDYTITVSVPGDIATSKKFLIYDTFDPALDYVQDSTTVAAVPASHTLTAVTDYTIDYDTGTRTLTVTFTDDGRKALVGATGVTVKLKAVINSGLLDAPNMWVHNIAHVQFTNKDGTDFEAESSPDDDPPPSTVTTAIITITKVDQDNQALNGATFAIASSEANAKAGNFIRQDPASKVLHDYDAAPDSAWAILGKANDYTISPDNSASFIGLRDAVDNNGTIEWQTYWVVEIAAPATYNMLTDPIVVSFEDAYNAADQPEDYTHVYQLTVTNSKGFMLPETGGLGTILWTVAGIVLMGTAVLIVVTKRKKTVTQ